MEPFAILFMTFSMLSVTVLVSYCYYRILTSPPPSSDEDAEG
jgi:hypothetical protein